MRYVKESLKYIFIEGRGKRFLCLFFISIIPMALLARAFPIDLFIRNIFYPPEFSKWSDVWFSFVTIKGFLPLFLGLSMSIVATAGICGALINHFRIGDLKLNKILYSFNDYFFPSVLYTLAITLIIGIIFILYTLFAYMWYSFESVLAYKILSTVTAFILALLTVYITSSLTLWLPTMCIKGAYRKSFFVAFSQAQPKIKSFLPGKIIPAIILIITAIISALSTNIWFVSWIITTVGYSFAFSCELIGIMITFFDENKLPRETNKNPYKRR